MDERLDARRLLAGICFRIWPSSSLPIAKMSIAFQWYLWGREIGKPIDDKGFSLFPRERQSFQVLSGDGRKRKRSLPIFCLLSPTRAITLGFSGIFDADMKMPCRMH